MALAWPSAFDWFSGTMIQVGLGIIMLGMGMTLTLADFKRVFLVPLALFGGVGLQFVVMPFLGWWIGHWMSLPRDMAVGLVLVSCCPGGTASNVVAFLARANVALSVSMTAISTTLAVVLTPLLTKFYVGERVPVDAWGLLQSILIIVILPVTAGIVINHFFGKAAKRLNAVSPFVSVVFIILIVGYILSQNRESIMENWRVLVAAVLLLHVGGFGRVTAWPGCFVLTSSRVGRFRSRWVCRTAAWARRWRQSISQRCRWRRFRALSVPLLTVFWVVLQQVSGVLNPMAIQSNRIATEPFPVFIGRVSRRHG